ncbi:MAG TPA: hypothetical protein VN284_14450 [Rhizobium sp.]|nr:hypothetical protein [Rhizobium sp.]
MGKSIALLFACAALVILAGSFVASGSVAAVKGGCSPISEATGSRCLPSTASFSASCCSAWPQPV